MNLPTCAGLFPVRGKGIFRWTVPFASSLILLNSHHGELLELEPVTNNSPVQAFEYFPCFRFYRPFANRSEAR